VLGHAVADPRDEEQRRGERHPPALEVHLLHVLPVGLGEVALHERQRLGLLVLEVPAEAVAGRGRPDGQRGALVGRAARGHAGQA
jgi:hypothetical protein